MCVGYDLYTLGYMLPKHFENLFNLFPDEFYSLSISGFLFYNTQWT